MTMVLLLSLCLLGFASAEDFSNYPCESKIYCHGRVLEKIQMEKLFEDSKHFVDMPMRWEPDQVVAEFDKMMKENDDKPTKERLLKFVNENFYKPGEDSEYLELEDIKDWKANVSFLGDIENEGLREWASDLHKFWQNLTLSIDKQVKNSPNRYSMIYVPNPVVVPGDRFREFYYWDSFWTIKGLLLSEMKDTVKGMLENFLSMVKTYGFVPNGGRVYYTKRSQPPFLIPMVNIYFMKTQDKDFLRTSIAELEKEFQFWMNQRSIDVTVDGKTYKMARYNVEALGPRPESYREDVELAEQKEDEKEKQEVYKELKTVAETGWDFSTRWYIDEDGTNKGDLINSKPRSIIPVDLNSLLCQNAKILSIFYDKLGQEDKMTQYRDEAKRIDEAIHEVLWDEEVGAWLDYDMINKKRRNYFYMSNLNPLWTECYDHMEDKGEMTKKVLKYLKEDTDALNYAYGVPTSLKDSGQQWDFPNGWPPIIHMLIEGLASLHSEEADELAFEIAQRWIAANYKAYKRSTHMFEKYNVVTGKGGSGGEYNVQLGFGWTNGVALDLLDKYSDRIRTTVKAPVSSSSSLRYSMLPMLCSIAGLILYGIW